MANYLVTDTELTSIANSIRAKRGTSAGLTFPDGMKSAIDNLSFAYQNTTSTSQVPSSDIYVAPNEYKQIGSFTISLASGEKLTSISVDTGMMKLAYSGNTVTVTIGFYNSLPNTRGFGPSYSKITCTYVKSKIVWA